MHKLIISAPFGNYLQWPGCTPTLGTYTREYRGGFWRRLWKVLGTVRYYHGIRAWKNKLGLPNPGVDDLLRRWRLVEENTVADKIVSVSARKTVDWLYLLAVLWPLRPLAVELNVSCPNTPGEVDTTDYETVYRHATSLPCEVIVKVPPVGYEWHIGTALGRGLTGFHCCNTLPTPGGGLSGKPLKPLSLAAVRYAAARGAGRLIGGGGVTTLADALDYLNAGATNVAVASVLFNPFLWGRVRRIAKELPREAEQRRPQVHEEWGFATREAFLDATDPRAYE